MICGYHREGATSVLEIGWMRKVERPHGLPRGARQVFGRVHGRGILRDVAYEQYGVFIELDGRLGHEGADHAFRDMDRDNAAAMEGRTTLRYGWTAVMTDPCAVAAQVAVLLRNRGWTGDLSRCRPDCRGRSSDDRVA
jgi:hypothetical protein